MVSIIIPVYNNIKYTKQCIQSIKENTSVEHEIIVVDNSSNDDTIEVLESCKLADKIVTLVKNYGFPYAINRGVEESKGDIICLLNNDIITTPGWLDRLIEELDHYDIVGPVTNFVTKMQKVRIGVYDNKESLYRKAKEWSQEHKGETIEVNWIIGFAMVFKKSLWDVVGPFDADLFKIGNYEDIDFCFNAKRLGFRIAIVKDVYLHHYGSKTFGLIKTSYNKLLYENQQKLLKKWGTMVHYLKRQEISGGNNGRGDQRSKDQPGVW